MRSPSPFIGSSRSRSSSSSASDPGDIEFAFAAVVGVPSRGALPLAAMPSLLTVTIAPALSRMSIEPTCYDDAREVSKLTKRRSEQIGLTP